MNPLAHRELTSYLLFLAFGHIGRDNYSQASLHYQKDASPVCKYLAYNKAELYQLYV